MTRKEKHSVHVRGVVIKASDWGSVIDTTRTLRPDDPDEWMRLITSMWFGGLRIGEALSLSWDEGLFQIDLEGGRSPRFRILAEGQKARRDEHSPMTPDFHKWITGLKSERSGSVCGIDCHKDTASKVVAQTLRSAGVNATAHDLRRSFGTRWAIKVKPAILMKLMRHASISTTMKYYVILDSDDVAETLWEDEPDVA